MALAERNRSNMQKKLSRYVHSFLILPIMAFSIPGTGFEMPKENFVNIPFIQMNNGNLKDADNHSLSLEYRAAMIDSYFAERDLPLAGYGKVFVKAADANNISWTLLPTIA